MSQSDLDGMILELLERCGPLAAGEISKKLSVDRTTINLHLHGPLVGQISQDQRYRWSVATQDKSSATTADDSSVAQNTELARLCRYYLSCMGQSDVGVSTFAQNKRGATDYLPLSVLPGSAEEFLAQENTQRLLGKVRKEQGRWEVYLGYPTAIRRVKSRRSDWEGSMVEPVILFPVELGGKGEEPQLDLSYPIINQRALAAFSNADRDRLMDELIQLEGELGLGDADQLIPVDELVLRLRSIRPEWPWIEDINPAKIADEPSLDMAVDPGIYNRAVVVMAERSPFTQGLETELKQLSQLPQSAYLDTALGSWIGGSFPSPEDHSSDDLIEVLPMNFEQRQAIANSLSKPLTIITGPPGTGKSQVVTNLMVNAAWHGKKVLFASKNNKAVDVVDTRVNSLGPRPLLLRVGSQQYQTRLAEFLMSFQSSSAGEDDKEAFEDSLTLHDKLKRGLSELDSEADYLVGLRNLVDKLEQIAEEPRERLPAGAFSKLREIKVESAMTEHVSLAASLLKAKKDRQSFPERMCWWLLRHWRMKQVSNHATQLRGLVGLFGVDQPKDFPCEENLEAWCAYSQQIGAQLSDASTLKEYQYALDQLQSGSSLEDIDRKRFSLLDNIARNSAGLWKSWLQLQPTKLDSEARQFMNRYTSLLKMVIDAGNESKLTAGVYKQYTRLSSQVAHLLPCWATTSLSTRGKIPFEAGFFDLVIFDEASQCDIASALPLLYRAKHAVIIGDPKQLSHISGLKQGQDQQLLDKHGLVEEFPHWSYSVNSLFDLAAGLVGQEGVVRLLDHHRSHADIIQFANEEFYEGRLRVATRYDLLKTTGASERGVCWVDVKGAVTKPASGGSVNLAEADAVAEALRDLVMRRGYSGSVGVVSPFRAQVNAIRESINRDDALTRALGSCSFLVDTVHRFQGDERDVMIFSPVYSDGISEGSKMFLSRNGNLFNVAITRARAQLIVVGDLDACSSGEVGYLASFALYAGEIAGREDSEQHSGDFDLGAHYPEVARPETVSKWEKILYKALYDAGIHTIPQFLVEKYALDFAVVSGDRKLNVEVDGERYHRNWTGELCRRDQLRNQRMFELGWDVMRFWVYEIRDDLPGCVARVQSWLKDEKQTAEM